MSRDAAHVLDILHSARLALSFVSGMSKAEFEQDLKTQSAVLYRLTIVGEATKRVTHAYREQHPEVPWRKMAGARDRVVHEYDRVNRDRVWEILEEDLPALVAALEPLELKRP